MARSLRSLRLLAPGFVGGLALWGYFVFRWRSPWGVCALAVTAVVGVHVLVTLHRHAHLNCPASGASLYPTLGAANVLTTARGLLLALLAGFLCLGRPPAGWRWMPGLLYAIAVAADFGDGLVARLTGHVSLLGEYLDMHMDGLGVLIASLLAVRMGQMPWWYALAGLARYLHLFGEWLLRRIGNPIHPLPPSPTRRALAGIQMGFLAAVLCPVFAPPATVVIGAPLFVPFILGFVRDFLAVAGCRWAVEASWLRLSFWQRHVLLVVRWLTGGVLLVALWSRAETMASCAVWGGALLALLLLGGILPRLAAAGSLAFLGFCLTSVPVDWCALSLAIGGAAVLTWGGGRFSVWMPEEAVFLHHVGER